MRITKMEFHILESENARCSPWCMFRWFFRSALNSALESHRGHRDSLSGVNETETESGFSKKMDKQICGNDWWKWCASVFMKQVSFSGTTHHILLQFRNKRLIFRCTRRVPLLNDTSKKRNVINTPPWASRSKHFFTLCGVSVKKDKLHIFFRNSNENVKV